MNYYIWKLQGAPYLEHFGIQGQKWGVRRYQNPDGSLTEEGKARYGYGSLSKNSDYNDPKQLARAQKGWQKAYGERFIDLYNESANRMNYGGIERFNKKWNSTHKISDKWTKEQNWEAMQKEYSKFFNSVLYKTASRQLGHIPGSTEAARKDINKTLSKYGETPIDW